MIDYVKVRTRQPGLAQRLKDDDRFRWIDCHDKEKNKIGRKGEYQGLTWIVFDSGFMEFTGSLHKCWNSLNGRGSVNWNDFRRLDLYDVLNWLAEDLGLIAETATIHNIEFGVNLILPPAPPTVRDILSRLLYYGNGQPFKEMPVEKGYYKRMETKPEKSDFYIKAYDKGSQYNTPDQRLRFEKGVRAMKDINPKNNTLLSTLDHLNDPARLTQLGYLLLTAFDRCFWAEITNLAELTDRERTVVENAHDAARIASLTPVNRNRLKTRYNQIAQHYGYRFTADLRQQINTKWADLLEVKCNVLQRGVKGFTHLTIGVNHYTYQIAVSMIVPTPTTSLFSNLTKSDRPPILTNPCPAAWKNRVKTACQSHFVDSNKQGINREINGNYNTNNSRKTVIELPELSDLNAGRETVPAAPGNSDKTVIKGRVPKRCTNRPTATQLRANPDLLAEVEKDRQQYAKGSKENRFERAAHHLRNDDSNDRNNLARRLRRLTNAPSGQPLPLYSLSDVIRLTPEQQAALDYWKGTGREIRF